MKRVAVAVGIGFGLRLDFSFYILRFDLAFPLHIPYLLHGERWVAGKIDLGGRGGREISC
jgi:outer membrane protein insertion porin family